MSGDAAEVTIGLIIRDFEREGLAQKGDVLRTVCAAVALTEPRAEVILRDHTAIPQHALLAGKGYDACRSGPCCYA